jgi:hypothetical protein
MATPEAVPNAPRPAGGRPRAASRLVQYRNPLWRGSDSARSLLRALYVLALGCAAVLCVLVALHQYQADRAETARYQARLHEVHAVALSDAVETGINAPYRVEVRWTDASGATHEGPTVAPNTTVKGSTVRVWLTAADRPAAVPATVGETASDAAAVGLILLASSALLLTTAHAVLRVLADRADLYRWEREWQLVEPAWSHRR